MNRLSSYLFRVAGLSVLIAVFVIFTSISIGAWWAERIFHASLSPEMLAEWKSAGPISAATSEAANTFFSGWFYSSITPVSVLIGVIVGGLVGMIHSRRLMRPLDAVAAALAALAQGDTAARANARPSKVTEIDAFQSNFNEMAGEVARAERELREMNAAIAHELRTPLTVLIGRLNGMADGLFPLDQDSVRALLTQTDQLHRTIEDLRLLTIAEAGRFRLDREDMDLADMVRGTLAVEADGIETDLRPARLRADPARMRQILAALLDNAHRYAAGADGVQNRGLRIETWAERGAAVLRVLDRGPGMRPDQAARAFDRFWRADASRGKHSGGSGLGLTVVRSLVQAHGGSVKYHDRPGGGAIFTVTIPVVRLVQQDDARVTLS